jgi:hypothetical protein
MTKSEQARSKVGAWMSGAQGPYYKNVKGHRNGANKRYTRDNQPAQHGWVRYPICGQCSQGDTPGYRRMVLDTLGI